jgi:hypothetical protein
MPLQRSDQGVKMVSTQFTFQWKMRRPGTISMSHEHECKRPLWVKSGSSDAHKQVRFSPQSRHGQRYLVSLPHVAMSLFPTADLCDETAVGDFTLPGAAARRAKPQGALK